MSYLYYPPSFDEGDSEHYSRRQRRGRGSEHLKCGPCAIALAGAGNRLVLDDKVALIAVLSEVDGVKTKTVEGQKLALAFQSYIHTGG